MKWHYNKLFRMMKAVMYVQDYLYVGRPIRFTLILFCNTAVHKYNVENEVKA